MHAQVAVTTLVQLLQHAAFTCALLQGGPRAPVLWFGCRLLHTKSSGPRGPPAQHPAARWRRSAGRLPHAPHLAFQPVQRPRQASLPAASCMSWAWIGALHAGCRALHWPALAAFEDTPGNAWYHTDADLASELLCMKTGLQPHDIGSCLLQRSLHTHPLICSSQCVTGVQGMWVHRGPHSFSPGHQQACQQPAAVRDAMASGVPVAHAHH